MTNVVANANKDSAFQIGEYVVYPTHGVGQVARMENQVFSGHELNVVVISFEKEKMTLRIPVAKVSKAGLRKLASREHLDKALTKLQGRARVRRVMWSRRAQEYEAKINSGDPVAIAEVVRDLFRSKSQTEQSYSERQIYQQALERLAREYAAIEKVDEKTAAERLEGYLNKVAA
ncbi:MAG: CarD family transcriptional regulator [Alphaproteobacteria bacterium]|nr:CarD family transcriptional regulator [Alphaproteobacteria bacterium]